MQNRPLVQADSSLIIKIVEKFKFLLSEIEIESELDYSTADIEEILDDICTYIDIHDFELLIDIKDENGLLFCNDFKLIKSF